MIFTRIAIVCVVVLGETHRLSRSGHGKVWKDRSFKKFPAGNSGFKGSEGFYYGDSLFLKSNALTPRQVDRLDKVYKPVPSPFGPFVESLIWQSEEVLSNGKNAATGFLLILNNGICGRWEIFQKDRFYHWHEGKAIIDKIHPNGTRVSECLGSTVLNSDCRYVVKIPRGWFADIRTIGDLAVLTGVLINGDDSDGSNVAYNFMLRNFGDRHGDIIRQTRKCYDQ